MSLSLEKQHLIVEDLQSSLSGKLDGSRKNLLVPICPFCGHAGYKYAIYIGSDISGKRFGMSNCFVCGTRFRTLKDTLKSIGREDLIPKETTELDDVIVKDEFFNDEIEDDVCEIVMPKGYKRCFASKYLKSRGWTADDYEYFPCGTTRGISREYNDYVLLEIRDDGLLVGFVGRSIMSKEEIDKYNERGRRKILRYKNSTENGFGKLLYNFDAVKRGYTKTVVLCEGPFDVVGLNRKLELYDNKEIVPLATFGKKISDIQIYKLQSKGVEQVVIGYDADERGREAIPEVASRLEKYFDVLIADIPQEVGKDWDEMSSDDAYKVFDEHLKTIREFNLD